MSRIHLRTIVATLGVVLWRNCSAFSPPRTNSQGPMTTSPSSLYMSFETSAMLTALDSFYQTQPYQAAFLTCSVKASAADFLTQKRTLDSEREEQSSVDIQRNVAFLVYGGLYQGICQEFIFGTLFPKIFGTDTSLYSVIEQVAMDMLVLTPLLCLPAAYLVKASMSEGESFQQGLEKYWNHVQQEGLLVKYWMLWVPVQSITFSVCPLHLRIPFIAAVSFVWLQILSFISSTEEKEQTTMKIS